MDKEKHNFKKNHLNQISEQIPVVMGIRKISDYVQFFINLDMGDSVSLVSFVNNEKMVLKHKLQNKEIKKESILEGLKILEELTSEIQTNGEKLVLEKYSNVKNNKL